MAATRQKIIVCGSRTWSDALFLCTTMEHYAATLKVFWVFGGCPTGADRIAEEWAEHNGWCYRVMPARWHVEGKSAGPKRNARMAQFAGVDGICLAFRVPGRSNGTDDMLDKARALGMQIRIYRGER